VPKGNSEIAAAIGPDGRVFAAINWQKVVHVYDTRPSFGVFVRTAASDREPGKTSTKYFADRPAAEKEARKQIAAVAAKGYTLAAVTPPLPDDERELRLKLLGLGVRVGAVIREAYVPGPSATAFRGPEGPVCPSCGKPMPLLAEAGGVQVYYCRSTHPHCEVATEAWAPGGTRSKLVRRVDTAVPSGWERVLDAPALLDLEFVTGMKQEKALRAARVDEDDWPGARGGDKVGGYPAWVQDAEYPPCPDCGEPMRDLLLQLASDGLCGWQFGDMGTAYVLACATHTARVELIWQAG
jgi:hypothetical protein